MKKALFSLLLLATCLTAGAQYREVNLPERPKHPAYRNYEKENSGFWCAVEAEGASSIMVGRTNMQYAGLSFTGGYRISEFLRCGVGFGGRVYVNNACVRNTDNRFGIPIYGNLRGNFISAYDRDGVPFWSLNVGGITKEGFFASPTIGYSFGGLRNNFQIGLCYTLASFENWKEKNTTYSYLGVKLGYEF